MKHEIITAQVYSTCMSIAW